MKEPDHFPLADMLHSVPSREPLPDVQELRQQFRQAIGPTGNTAERAQRALEHSDLLRKYFDIQDGPPMARLYFDTVENVSHKHLNDLYRRWLAEYPADMTTGFRAESIGHAIAAAAGNKRMQVDIAEILTRNPDVPALKTFTRIRGLVENASHLITNESNMGKRALVGILAEYRVLEALHHLGLSDARYATVKEDVRDKKDIIIPGVRNVGRVSLQVKTTRQPGILIVSGPRTHRRVDVGPNPDSPFKLTNRQRKGLRHGVIGGAQAA